MPVNHEHYHGPSLSKSLRNWAKEAVRKYPQLTAGVIALIVVAAASWYWRVNDAVPASEDTRPSSTYTAELKPVNPIEFKLLWSTDIIDIAERLLSEPTHDDMPSFRERMNELGFDIGKPSYFGPSRIGIAGKDGLYVRQFPTSDTNLYLVVDEPIYAGNKVNWLSEVEVKNRTTNSTETFGLIYKLQPFEGDPSQTVAPNLIKMPQGLFYVQARWIRLSKDGEKFVKPIVGE